jgi:hypothetical protein
MEFGGAIFIEFRMLPGSFVCGNRAALQSATGQALRIKALLSSEKI